MTKRRFYDPLYGPVSFDEAEQKLIFSAELQRLRYIRMCNINSLMISGASEPSRFEHIIGVFHLAKEWVTANGIGRQDSTVIIAAALLHDVQTGPFGHSFEYILDDNNLATGFKHADIGGGAKSRYLQSTQFNVHFSGYPFSAEKTLGCLWPRVVEAIEGNGPFGSIIAGTIDLDNIDNVVRLAYHVGVASKDDAGVCIGLARDLRLTERGISVSRVGLELISRWQRIRESLYGLLLHDSAEFAGKAMLTTMMELAVQHQILGPESWLLTDDELMSELMNKSIGEAQYIGELARRLRTGNLYEPLMLWKVSKPDQYVRLAAAPFKRALEKKLSELLHCRSIFHVILDKGKTRRQLRVLLREDGQVRSIGESTNELLVGVFLSRPDVSAGARREALALIRHEAQFADSDISEIDDPVPSVDLSRTQLDLF